MEVTEAATGAAPRLPAVLADWAVRVINDRPDLLRELADGLGGPYHALYPEQFVDNATAFRSALGAERMAGTVYYAKKANKAASWIRAAAELGLGVDVASTGELGDALRHGVTGDRLMVTGPAKPAELLRLAVLHRGLVAVDSVDELDRITEVGRTLGEARILLRCLPDAQPHSRFGLDTTELEHALTWCTDNAGAVRLEGFSFHLSGYDLHQRADHAGRLLGWCERARTAGLPADRISIGGGIPVSYLDAATWAAFNPEPDHFHAGRTFGGFYPYHSPVTGADALTAILRAYPAGRDRPLADLLREARVDLLVEPGRALLDQAGFTVFSVLGVKPRRHGIVTVDGTSLSLSEQWFNSEYLVDPVLIARTPAPNPEPFVACVGAATCLESDMLTWRKVQLPQAPAPGDLLVYPNTAGYQMDSNESPFHDLPLPPKVVLRHDGPALRWHLDRPAR